MNAGESALGTSGAGIIMMKEQWIAGGTLAFLVAAAYVTAAQADGYSPPVEPMGPTEELCFDKGLNDYVPCVDEVVVFAQPWTGFYGGLHAGMARADWDGYAFVDEDTVGDYVNDEINIGLGGLNDTGFVVGGQVGYMRQSRSDWVIGVEGDFSFAFGLEEDVDFSDTWTGVADRDGDASFSSEVDWLASLRLRAGRAFGDFMPFATAGVGFGRYDVSGVVAFEDDGDANDTPLSGSADGVAIGPVFGGGLDYMIAPNVILRGEALYYWFGEDVDMSEFDIGTVDGAAVDVDGRFEFENVLVGRLALNIKF